MPSFFYHLAFDLTTELNLKPNSVLNYWEAFQITPRTKPQHRPQPSLHTESDIGLSNSVTSEEHNRPAKGVVITSQHSEDHALSDPDRGEKPPQKNIQGSSCVDDWRHGRLLTQGVKMAQAGDGARTDPKALNARTSNGIGAGQGGLATQGRFEPSSSEEKELGWGVVRLYKDGEETPGLYDEPNHAKASKSTRALQRKDDEDKPAFKDEDCTTLCILAVPSYLTPSDFLGFVGEKTREEVSHFRMIRTERSNRYMVLMKFRNGRYAREWRREWNGKAFDSMEPENCHVVFVKSIAFLTPSPTTPSSSFPDMTNDPFTPSPPSTLQPTSSSRTAKPLAPPTPSLIELPTCPVCLERMDESTGLLTVLCQHVFHCSCLQKWRGSGCPVCRYTQKSDSRHHSRSHSHLRSAGDGESGASNSSLNECSTCHSSQNLWICLICGNVGCGRYDAAHAFAHFTDEGHAFAMDLSTQRVWDYASDAYVHRLVQNAHDGKLVDLSSPATHGALDYQHTGNRQEGEGQGDDYDDFVPRSKLQTAGIEYTHLLTSQLDSQRMYFEGILERAADKASLAAQSADKAQSLAEKTQTQLGDLETRFNDLSNELEDTKKERDRVGRKAEKFETMARKLEREWREEKTVSASLMTRIEYLQTQLEALGKEKEGLVEEKKELEEMVRDLMFTIEGGRRVKELGEEGEGAAVALPESQKRREGGGKGGGRKKKGKK